MRKRILVAVTVALLCGWLCPASQADAFNVTVSTNAIQGQSGFVILDFIGGSLVFNNNATISVFASDAALGSATTSGAVSGTLTPGPLMLSDTAFLSEWNQGVTFGSTMSFKLALDTNFTMGEVPDEFSFFLADSTGTPFSTSDPTGANSLFVIDVNGSPLSPVVFTSDMASATVTSATVPDASTFSLMLSGIVSALAMRRRRPSQS